MSENARHVKLIKTHINQEHFEKYIEENVFKNITVKNKVVIDYGIGGGFVAKMILDKGCKKYIGYDIAEKQIEISKNYLKNYSNIDFIQVNGIDFDFKKADLLVCLAVIQHFPTEDYYNSWLLNVNTSGIKELYLQIRNGKKLEFKKNTYKTIDDIIHACYTNEKDVSKKLSNYKLSYASKENATKYVYLKYEITSSANWGLNTTLNKSKLQQGNI